MEKGHYIHVKHGFEPVFDSSSRILILGTLPSVKSREQNFYYGHPQNRFWKLLARICENEKVPESIKEKKVFLLTNHIAIWDVISECDIIGSSDSSIKNVVPTDLNRILEHAPIQQIYGNGGKAYELYQKYSYLKVQRKMTKLPSTSPANAAWQMDRLESEWEQIREIIKRG